MGSKPKEPRGRRPISLDDSPAWFVFGWTILADTVAARRDDSERADPEQVRQQLEASLSSDGAFAAVVANARLTPADAEVLALLATADSDEASQQLVTELRGTSGGLTLGLIGSLLDRPEPSTVPMRSPAALSLATGAPLRQAMLVDVVAEGPWVHHRATLHPSVIWALIGDRSPDADLPDGVEYHEADREADDGARADLLVVNGSDRMRRRQFAATASNETRFLCTTVPKDDTSWAAIIREATITGRGIIIETNGATDASGTIDARSRRWLERTRHLSWVISTRTGPPISEMPSRPHFRVSAPSHEPTADEWAALLGDDVERTHRLTYDQLHRVARAAEGIVDDDPTRRLDAAVRRLASGELEQLTTRVRPTRDWEDLVVAPERRALLQSIVDRYQRSATVYDDWGFTAVPSRGVVALLSGPSGTGKTLASEVVAGALGLDMFKLDLSAVVSKYIGETEKNLERVFDAASTGNVVLFFDEADALFGKRSEVKDARDRYANIEVSYLLQRIEQYDGVVILATNFEKNVDEAFLRRIHVRVPFALPEAVERRAIWAGNVPADAPVGDIDIEWLADQFEMSGGAIRNAAIHAAFATATGDGKLSTRAMVQGIAREFRKMGRLIRPDEFGDYHDAVVGL